MAETTAARPAWLWNEFAQVGTDYADVAEVRRYDERMSRFRDTTAEAAAILRSLALAPEAVVVEIGCGTGTFGIAASRVCRRVVAVDVSRAMLEYAAGKARAAGCGNIEFRHGGFLDYEHAGEPADAVVSSLALHHLPDFWKAAALRRAAAALKTGGRLFLRDVVFADGCTEESLPALVAASPETARAEVVVHIAREYSTFGWILEGLLERSGFDIEEAAQEGFLRRYLCRKR